MCVCAGAQARPLIRFNSVGHDRSWFLYFQIFSQGLWVILMLNEKDNRSYCCDYIVFISWVSMVREFLLPFSLMHKSRELLKGRVAMCPHDQGWPLLATAEEDSGDHTGYVLGGAPVMVKGSLSCSTLLKTPISQSFLFVLFFFFPLFWIISFWAVLLVSNFITLYIVSCAY